MAKTVYQILVELEGNEKAKAGMESLGQAAGLTGAALTAASVGAGKLAAEYDFNLQKIQTVANEMTGDVGALDAAFNDLSNQMDGSISVNEAAIASYDIASAGYKDQADILAILKTSQEAAIGGYSDLATVSDATTTIMNAFGDTLGENLTVTERAQKVTDLLIQTQNDGKTTVNALAQSYGNIAATAASAGVEFEVVNAFLANSTAQGLQTSSAISGLTQVIAGIQKPTAEAAKEAERLGINFDATALKTQGLDGIMLQIAGSTNLADDSIAKLFGSTEAQTVMNQALANSGQNVIDALNNQNAAVGTTSDAYAQMADTDMVKAQQAMNKLQNTIIKLGQGVLVAVEPAIDALTFLVDNFNKLPDPMKQAIGLATVIGGVTLTAAGGILMLAANVTTLVTNVSAAIPVLTKLIVKLTAMQKLNWAGMAAGMKGMGAAAVALGPVLVAAAGAIASVTLAVKQYQNIQKQFEMDEIAGLRQQTEPLVQAARKMRLEMEETGKAIPDDEFEHFINILEDANSEHGELTAVIQAMKNAQAEKKAATEADTQATKDGTQAANDATQANQEQALSEEELAEKEEERAQKFAEYVQERQNYTQLLQQEMQAELTQIELNATSEKQAIEDKLTAQRQYLTQVKAEQVALLQQSQLTAEQRRQVELNLQQTLNQIAAAEAEARRAQMQLQIDEVTLALESARSEAEAIQNLARVNLDNNQATLSYVGQIKGLYSELNTLFNDQNSSLQFQNELRQIAGNLDQNLIDNGITLESTADNLLGFQHAANQLATLEIELKKEQLQIEQEIIQLEADARRAEIEGAIEIARIQKANAQTDEELAKAEAALEIEQRKLEVLEKQTAAKLRANQLDQSVAKFEGQIANAKANEAQRDFNSPSGQAGQPVETEAEKRTAESTQKTAEATAENATVAQQTASNVAQQTTETQEQTGQIQASSAQLENLADISQGILENTGAVVRQLDFIQKQLKSLPGQIASKIPRPKPPRKRD